MNIDKVIEILDSGKAPETEQDFEDFDTAIETAINLLKTHPDNQPNDPLTPEELREMDGEPVWLVGDGLNSWDIFSGVSTDGIACFLRAALPMDNCGRTWFPFRRKPEEGA